MKNKIFDVVPARNKWERRIAHIEWLRVGLLMPIKVTTSDDLETEMFWSGVVQTYQNLPCGVCGRPCLDPEYKPYLLCSERCDQIACDQVDSEQQGDND